MSAYTIEGGAAGKARLDVLASVMAGPTNSLLLRAGVRAGDRCIDVGCGGGNVSRELGRMVGEGGGVLGVDCDSQMIALARHDTDASNLPHVSFAVADARDIPDGPYDVAYARFLLSHLAEEATSVLTAMVGSLAPGGLVIVEDTDFGASFCYPESSAYQRYVDLYCATVRRRGGNPDIGPSLPGLLRAACVHDVALTVAQPAALTGEVKRLTLLTLQGIAASVVDERLATQGELDQLEAELREYAKDPTTVMSVPRVVQAWGRISDEPPK